MLAVSVSISKPRSPMPKSSYSRLKSSWVFSITAATPTPAVAPATAATAPATLSVCAGVMSSSKLNVSGGAG